MMKFFWLDMEMTGLDVEKEVVIEVAVMITNNKLETLDTYHAIVKQPQDFVDRMDSWNKKTHGESGLTPLIATGKDPDEVEKELLALVEKHFEPKDRIILAGNSIGQDRLFINKYFKQFAERLHYRMVDVTSFKIIFNNMFQISYAKKVANHRAIEDVQESINELKRYLEFVK
jgi:oligoribonuclease